MAVPCMLGEQSCDADGSHPSDPIHASAEGETEEILSRSQDFIVEWLKRSSLLPRDSSALYSSSAQALVDPEIILACVRWLCRSASVSDLPAAMRFLQLGLEEGYDIRLASGTADLLLDQAMSTGALAHVVWFWRHILAFAVHSEAKAQVVETLMELPMELQEQTMYNIQKVERRYQQCEIGGGELPGDGVGVDVALSPQRRPPSPQKTSRESIGGCSTNGRRTSIGEAYLRSQELARENERLKAQLKHLTDHVDSETATSSGEYKTLWQENETLRAHVDHLSLQAEKDRAAIQRGSRLLDEDFDNDAQKWQLERQLKERDERLYELEREVSASREMVDKCHALAEEVELYKVHQAEHEAMKIKFERQQERINEKMEEVAELKREIKGWAAKHGDAMRECNDLTVEVTQLRATGNQLDAWRQKVRELELRCADDEMRNKKLESRAKEAESEKERLVGENYILEEKLREAQVQGVVQNDCDGTVCDGEIVEPFTDELRERMQFLEARNGALEEQLTAEGSARCAQLVVEVESLKSVKEHLESRCIEIGEKFDTTLDVVGSQKITIDQQCKDAENQKSISEDLIRQISDLKQQLEREADEVNALCRERESLTNEVLQSRSNEKELQDEIERLITAQKERQEDARDRQILLLKSKLEENIKLHQKEADELVDLRSQLERSICRGQQLEELLEKCDHVALQALEEQRARDPSEANRIPQRPWDANAEVAQLRVQKLRLQNEKKELQVRETQATLKLNEYSLALSQLKNEFSRVSLVPVATRNETLLPTTMEADAELIDQENKGERRTAKPPAPSNRPPLQELPLEQFLHEEAASASQKTSLKTPSLMKASQPKSILKKSRLLEPEAIVKGDALCNRAVMKSQQAKRPGLIGAFAR